MRVWYGSGVLEARFRAAAGGGLLKRRLQFGRRRPMLAA